MMDDERAREVAERQRTIVATALALSRARLKALESERPTTAFERRRLTAFLVAVRGRTLRLTRLQRRLQRRRRPCAPKYPSRDAQTAETTCLELRASYAARQGASVL